MAREGDAPRRVLVVTDDPAVEETARHAFPPEVAVDVAGDARQAWDIMRTNVPDVAVLELSTGSAGGFALAREMSFDERLARVPIVMLLDRDHDVWLAGQAGAKLIRTKPIDPAVLAQHALSLADGS